MTYLKLGVCLLGSKLGDGINHNSKKKIENNTVMEIRCIHCKKKRCISKSMFSVSQVKHS